MRGGSDISCPEEAIWLEVAAGLTPSSGETEQLLAHSAGCAQCAAALARSLRTLANDAFEGEDEIVRALKSSGRKWQRQTAEMIAGPPSRRPCGSSAGLARRRLVAGMWRIRWEESVYAAAAIASSGRRHTPRNARWSFEFRAPPTVHYGLQRGARPARSDRPAELSEMDAAIRRHLDAAPGDPLWLWTKGRADYWIGVTTMPSKA